MKAPEESMSTVIMTVPKLCFQRGVGPDGFWESEAFTVNKGSCISHADCAATTRFNSSWVLVNSDSCVIHFSDRNSSDQHPEEGQISI